MQKHTYEVIVGNVGAIGEGFKTREDAERVYGYYVGYSKEGVGLVAGESVTLMIDGEPVAEYAGALQQD